MGLAMEVSSRLWLAGIVCVARDQVLADRLMLRVRRCTSGACRLLICVDGWMCYPAAILRAFSQQVKHKLQVWPQLIIGQVIKTQKHYHLESVKQTLLCGEEKGLKACARTIPRGHTNQYRLYRAAQWDHERTTGLINPQMPACQLAALGL